MSYGKMALFGAAATIAIYIAQSQAAVAATEPAPQSGATSVTEVIVTAQKRQENVQNVGMSIQAASGAKLTQLGVTDTSQLQKLVPGFSYVPSAYGTPIYSIRGVGYQDTSLAGSPTVSVYVDEAPLPFSSLTQGATLDLQRVEVMKGPQGTLFGENATGGAINYVANKPSDHFTAGADLSYGRFNTIDLQGFVGGPISDTLDARIALRTQQSDGWQKSYAPQAPAMLGAKNFYNGRLSLLWKPNDKFKALLTFSAWQDRSETQAPQLYGISNLNTNSGLPYGLVHYPLAPHNDQAAGWDTCINSNGTNTSCTWPHNNNRFYSPTLRLDYDLGHDLVLTSLTTYEHYDRYSALPGDGTTYQEYQSIQMGFVNTYYEELRLAGKFSGRGNWIVGANYEYDDTFDNFLQTFSDSSSQNVFGLPLETTNPIDRQHTYTYAIFGNGEYPITDTVTLQGGVRYTNQHKSFNGCALDTGDGEWAHVSQLIQNYLQYSYGYLSLADYLAGGGTGINPGPGGCSTTGPAPDFHPYMTYAHLNQDNVAWRAGVNWKAVPGTLVYFNVSQGYKSGAFPTIAVSSYKQLPPAVQEGLLAYEGGIKSSLFDHTLQLDAAVFYYDYKNKQILGALADPVFGALNALVNIPRSHVVGFEVSGTWQPIRGLTIAPTVTYSDSRIDPCPASISGCEFAGPGLPAGQYHNYNYLAQLQNFNGEHFPSAPQWQADVDAQYEWSLRDDVTAFVGVNVNYQGQTNSAVGNWAVMNVPGYALVDLRAGVAKDAWRFQLWGRNVANQYYWTAAYHVNDVFVRYAGMPTTYGFTLSYRYH